MRRLPATLLKRRLRRPNTKRCLRLGRDSAATAQGSDSMSDGFVTCLKQASQRVYYKPTHANNRENWFGRVHAFICLITFLISLQQLMNLPLVPIYIFLSECN